MSTELAEPASGPLMTANTSAASSTLRHKGPMRSRLGVKGIAPFTGTRPNVGGNPTTPHGSAGVRMDPKLSVPMENAHRAAAVAAPEPELEPPAGSAGFHGFLHFPPNHSQPLASSPMATLPSSTAPASLSIVTIAAFSAGIWLRYNPQSHVVASPGGSDKSISEYG